MDEPGCSSGSMSPEMSDALVLGGVAAAVALAGACVVGAVRRVRKRAPPPAAAASSAPSSSVVVDDGVGILALETYFPSRYVEQTAMEVQDGCAGKYTKGLGQRAMAFVDDREDVNSICLSAAVRLLDRYGIDRSRIGRVEVGTETLVDKSKSAKTVLMQLFEHGDVEGVTCVNACYGGTAALFNTLAWARSAECRGRLGLVVAADIAVYAPGNARATGGCGAVAILVGAGAPLVVECGTRASHAEHVWDFFKPCMASEYPVVDGKLSQSVYMRSFDRCMESFHANSAAAGVVAEPDFYVFHAPYNKLVQKTFGRIAYQRFLQNPDAAEFASIAPETRAKLRSISLVDSYASRDVDLAFRKHSAEAYAAQVVPSTLLPREIGNCYTASLYAGLVSLVSEAATNDALPSLLGKRVCMFSYGSGCVASTFALRVREGEGDFTLKRMASTIDLQARLEARTVQTVGEYTRALDCRRRLHDHLVHSTASAAAMQAFKGATPNGPLAHIPVGAFYLARVTENYQREYVVRTAAAAAAEAASPRSRASLPGAPTPLDLDALLAPGWNSTRVTGIAAGIPGRDRVFDRRTNVSTLLSGEPLIRALSDDAVQSVLARNPRRRTVTVSSDGTKTVTDVPLGSPENSLRVASTLGAFDLVAEYGIDARIVAGMEMTCQLAIAAAFEALLDAELVAGGGDWLLNETLRERTGIVCAASYAGVEASIDAAQSPTFDRKFLFKVLVPGAAQIAQLVGARGPCIQLNAACAGTTQAIAVAQDWLNGSGWGHRNPRVDRVIVVASDNASGASLLPFVGGGFAALGAASTAATPELSAMPFDARRNGMVLGAGAVALVLERASSAAESIPRSPVERSKCCLIATQISNSAFHGSRLDPEHIAHELVRFLADLNSEFGLTKEDIAKHGVYLGHETSTTGGHNRRNSCAAVEVIALRNVFGSELLAELRVGGTKGATGHAMGVAFEEVIAVEMLRTRTLPFVCNFQQHDPLLQPIEGSNGGDDAPLRLTDGSAMAELNFVLRFSAGFGSQISFALYGKN